MKLPGIGSYGWSLETLQHENDHEEYERALQYVASLADEY